MSHQFLVGEKDMPKELFRKEVFFAERKSSVSKNQGQKEGKKIIRNLFWASVFFSVIYFSIIFVYAYSHKTLLQVMKNVFFSN